MMSRLPLMIWSVFFLAAGSVINPEHFWLVGGAMILLSATLIYRRKELPRSMKELLSFLGFGSAVIFLAGIFVGLAFLFGSYVLPVVDIAISTSTAQAIGAICIVLSVLAFSKKGGD